MILKTEMLKVRRCKKQADPNTEHDFCQKADVFDVLSHEAREAMELEVDDEQRENEGQEQFEEDEVAARDEGS